jgi:hypothetical protein
MAKAKVHKWEFQARFRRNGFGWRSQPAITRIKQAVAEIKKATRADPFLAAEGAILFLERVSPALERVDSSSGSIGSAVNYAIEELTPIIATATTDTKTRDLWLDRLWAAFQQDSIPYIEYLGEFWGPLCATKETASAWADQLINKVRESWKPSERFRYCKGTTICFSALLFAARYQDILDLLTHAPYISWSYRRWGVKALVAQGKRAEAIQYAEASRGLNDSPISIALASEEILLNSGMAEEAYKRYALAANRAGSYIATYRLLAKKYPNKATEELLSDLVTTTPGEEGKWFATAKELGLYELAITLANRSPCDPKTLARAARDFLTERPSFALEAGITALTWMSRGYGYEITGLDILGMYTDTLKAAETLGSTDAVKARIREAVKGTLNEAHVTKLLRSR